MKICNKCGDDQPDNQIFCSICGEKLDSLSMINDPEYQRQMKEINEVMHEDPFRITIPDRIAGYLSIACIPAFLVYVIYLFVTQADMQFSPLILAIFILNMPPRIEHADRTNGAW